MLCCVGLFAGMSVGQAMGGPWTYIAPAAGFGIGFLGDMKLMGHMHKKNDASRATAQVQDSGQTDAPEVIPSDAKPAKAWELAA